MTPLKVGVMGLGQRGLQHLAALVRLQGEGLAEVTVLCDASPNLATAKLRSFVPDLDLDNVLRTESCAQLLEAEACQALFVAIPPSLHRNEVTDAAGQGLHLMVEKPMSLHWDQAMRMQDAIDAAGVLACGGFQQRFDPRHEAVRAYVAARRPVLAAYAFHASLERHDVKHTATHTLGGPANRVWAANQAWSGTTVVEAGIHPLDLWRDWFGEVQWVQAAYVPRADADIVDQADNPFAYSVQFGFEQGLVGNLVLSRLRRVANVIAEHRVFCAESQVDIRRDAVIAYGGNRNAAADRVLWQGATEDGTYPFVKAFVQAVRDGNPALIRSPFADAMRSLAGVLAANASQALEGQRMYMGDFLAAGRLRQPAPGRERTP